MRLKRSTLNRLIGWSPVLLLGSLAALTYWLNAQVQLRGPFFDGSGRHDPDVYIEDFKAESLDAQGRVRQALTARLARHYPDDDTTEFDAPLITFSDPGKPALSVTADRAIVTGDREHAYFSGHVRGVREPTAADAHDGPVVLTSEYLHVIPKEDRVVTDKPVTIEDPRGIIHATGMEFDNRSRKVKFGSHISGSLQPQK
ncbi:MAG: LPS export ABC transporter periplasmic protein LptC [Betaproteobacteria bacterium]|nr:MAG: LPS export ABC transporter periplasmic protein LptC [Betaproteobacteria bacterium]